MKRFLLEIQIGFLVIVGVALVLGTGYLAYTGMNSILHSVAKESKPDLKLNMIQLLATDMEKAENSVRMFAFTRKDQDLQPYYSLVTSIDNQLETLREEGKDEEDFLLNMDTITQLVEKKILIWNEMLPLYKIKEAEQYLDTISSELEHKIEQDSIRKNRNIFQKIFKRQKKVELDEEKIVQEIEDVQQSDSLRDARIKNKELQLALANSKLTQHFYNLIKRLEETELSTRRQKVLEADKQADEAYKWIGWFSLSAVISLLLVIYVITRYARKSHKYQLALMKARNEAENLAKAKEIFVATVSHELRTPMNVITGFVAQLLKRPMDEDTRETLQIIQASSDHLVGIVNDILDFSKLDSGKMILNPVHYNTQQHFKEIQRLFHQQLVEKEIELKIELDKNIPEALYGDPIRMKQILINLVGNAIKFTEKGSIVIEVHPENMLAGHLDLKIVVSDTGIGIAPDKLRVIFEEFIQAESGTTQKYGGTGLGLSIVRKLVDLHNGTIQVSSEENEGTTFTVRMPYKKGDPQLVESALVVENNIPPELKDLKVLVVDDEEYNRKLVAAILRKWQVPFVEASLGREAVDLSLDGSFDVILMDNRMPGMDGLEATRIIRQKVEKDPSKLAIVYFSAAAVPEDKLEAQKKAGISAWLPKPFKEEELLAILLQMKGLEVTGAGPIEKEPELPAGDESDKLDLDQLYRVAGGDEVFVSEMLEKFMESFESGYKLLMEQLRNDNVEEAGNIAHKLASPCRHIGADRLLILLKDIENNADEGFSFEELTRKAEQAGEAYENVKRAVLHHLEKR